MAAGGERTGASGQLLEVQQAGLVGVKQPSAFGLLGVEGGVQSLELAGDQLVLVGGAREDGALAGKQLLWVKQRLADLVKDVLVELVRADVALWTETVFRSGAQHVVVAASVVTGQCAVAPIATVTAAGNMTVTALNQSAQQPRVGRGATGAQLEVVVGDVGDTLKCLTVDDRRHRDRDPLLARALAQPGLAPAYCALGPS